MKTRSYTRGKGGHGLSTASVAQQYQCLQSMCIEHTAPTPQYHHYSNTSSNSTSTHHLKHTGSGSATTSTGSAASHSASQHNAKLVKHVGAHHSGKAPKSGHQHHHHHLLGAPAADTKTSDYFSGGGASTAFVGATTTTTSATAGSGAKPAPSPSPSPPLTTLHPPVLPCGCSAMGSASVKPAASSKPSAVPTALSATAPAAGNTTTTCAIICCTAPTCCGGASTAPSSVTPGAATASTSAISATDMAGSTTTGGSNYQVTSHYPPFTDPQIKKMAEQFMSTVNAHSYGYTAITQVTRIDTLHNNTLSVGFDTKRLEFGKNDVELNEVLAFHGTPRDANIESISRNNFDNKRLGQTTGNQGWYGSGVYLTQHAGAALRYQYWNTSTPPERMLLCRVLLGRVFTVPENSCDFIGKGITPGHHSHRGRDRWDADWQLVVFDNAQILPFAHIHYR